MGQSIDWWNYDVFLPMFACECAKKTVEKGYNTFGLEYYGTLNAFTLYHCLPSGNSILILRDLVTSYEHCKGSSVWCLFVWNVYAYDRLWNVFSFHVWAQTNQITPGIDQSRFTCRNWTAFSYESWAFLQVLILCSLADYRACLLFPWT
jgi:hypothetical protein